MLRWRGAIIFFLFLLSILTVISNPIHLYHTDSDQFEYSLFNGQVFSVIGISFLFTATFVFSAYLMESRIISGKLGESKFKKIVIVSCLVNVIVLSFFYIRYPLIFLLFENPFLGILLLFLCLQDFEERNLYKDKT